MPLSKRSSGLPSVDLDDEGHPVQCPNCQTEKAGPYCHTCGQRFLQRRLSAKELGWLFVDRFLDWEQGLWPTFTGMVMKPGTVIASYLDGRRRRYLNPFSYLVICALFYATLQALLRRSAAADTLMTLEMGQWATALGAVENEYSMLAYGTVLGVGLVAPALRLMFDEQLLNITEAVITALYAAGSVFLYAIPLSLATFLWTGHPLTTSGLATTFGLLFPLCMGYAGYGLFGSVGMAGYTGLAPFMGGMMGVLGFFVALGIASIATIPYDAALVLGLFFAPFLLIFGFLWRMRS